MPRVEFPPGFFDRVATDRRHVAPLDDAAVASIRDLYSDLGVDGRVLDLNGPGHAHFDVPPDELVTYTGDLDEPLPYGDDAFDDIVCAGPVGAFTRPRETFAEVARVLRPRGRFICSFATALDPRVAVRGWVAQDDAGRVRLVRSYFSLEPAFGPAESDLRTSLTAGGDRVWAVWAAKRG